MLLQAHLGNSGPAFCNYPTYCVANIGLIFDLILSIRQGCATCGRASMQFNGFSMEGHTLCINMHCICGNIFSWNSSSQYPDGSFQVNRDICRAWFVTGGERGHYFKFTSAFNIGSYNHSSFDSTIQLLRPIIWQLEDDGYAKNIALCNQQKCTYIGCDCQHCR